jgi:ABC-type tungstate transport system substrate-binding protein
MLQKEPSINYTGFALLEFKAIVIGLIVFLFGLSTRGPIGLNKDGY